MNAPRGHSSNLGADGKVRGHADSAFLGVSDHGTTRTARRIEINSKGLPPPEGFGTRNKDINIQTLLRKRATQRPSVRAKGSFEGVACRIRLGRIRDGIAHLQP
jgi:hypothetical protein